MKVNHISYSPAYCRALNEVHEITDIYMQRFCMRCPYFEGDYQGGGIECLWEDTGKNPIDLDPNPYILLAGKRRTWPGYPKPIEEELKKNPDPQAEVKG